MVSFRLVLAFAAGTAALAGAADHAQLREMLRRKHMSLETTEAAGKVAEFEKTKDVEILRAAMVSLGQINLAGETNTAKRLALRKDALNVWLAIAAAIDRNLDPNFDPNEENYVKLTPPAENGRQLPSGASPQMIDDPVKRKQYEHAIRENDRKIQAYSFQTRLRRFDDMATPNLERFLRNSYSSAPPDQRELGEAVQAFVVNPVRADRLRRAGSGKAN